MYLYQFIEFGMFALVFLWFGMLVPLVFVDSFVGFKKQAIEDPVKTNNIPRQNWPMEGFL